MGGESDADEKLTGKIGADNGRAQMGPGHEVGGQERAIGGENAGAQIARGGRGTGGRGGDEGI